MDDREKKIDVAGVTIIWGDAARGKAALRDESLKEHLARPVAERLAAALALVRPRPSDVRAA